MFADDRYDVLLVKIIQTNNLFKGGVREEGKIEEEKGEKEENVRKREKEGKSLVFC